MGQMCEVLGIGAATIDGNAVVESYPLEDEKIRTKSYSQSVGGNAFNACSAMSRLGLKITLLSKIGNDDKGNLILDRMKMVQIDSKNIVAKNMSTSFTYIIVNQKNGSRTCIHTPSEELLESDVSNKSILDGIQLLYSDSRHTLAALKVAEWAKERNIPLLLDCEKDRGKGFPELLSLATFVVTNSKFPHLYTRKEDKLEALLCIKEEHARNAKIIISTLGSQGSILISNQLEGPKGIAISSFPELLERVSSQQKVQRFEYKHQFSILYCPIYPTQVVDTTGAGDCFIGTICVCILKKIPWDISLQCASYVASKKCEHVGASNGIPEYVVLKEKFGI